MSPVGVYNDEGEPLGFDYNEYDSEFEDFDPDDYSDEELGFDEDGDEDYDPPESAQEQYEREVLHPNG